MPFSLKMSKNIKPTKRLLKYSYISIFTNLLRIDHFYGLTNLLRTRRFVKIEI